MTHPNAMPLHCIFYSHPWTALLLKQIKNLDFTDSVLVELSSQQVLSQVLPNKQAPRSCLTQLLAQHQAEKKSMFSFLTAKKKAILQILAQKPKEMPAPLVFAPRSGVSALNQVTALLLAANQANPFAQVVLLIHYAEAADFSLVYDYVDKFHLLWDMADLPGTKLTELTQLLASQNQLTAERWAGFYLCNHPKRQVADSEQRQALFESVMIDYQIQV